MATTQPPPVPNGDILQQVLDCSVVYAGEMVLSPTSVPTHEGPAAASLLSRVVNLLKILGGAYGVGFGVILLHTAKLNGPVVEALQFQNVIAGLPVWVPVCIGFWLWPRLVGPIVGELGYRIELSALAKLVLGVTFIVACFVIYAELRWIVGRNFSAEENVVAGCAIVFVGVTSMFLEAFTIKHSPQARFTAFFRLLTVYSGIAALVIGYALLGYPRLPQSLGGGRPVQVKIYYKDKDLSRLLGGGIDQGGEVGVSDPVLLYYRTGSYLLVSKDKNQQLVQIPMDQIRSVVWLESRSQ